VKVKDGEEGWKLFIMVEVVCYGCVLWLLAPGQQAPSSFIHQAY